MPDDAALHRERMRQVYSSGDQLRLSLMQEPIAHALVAEAGVVGGERVLDLGAGTGNVALQAARLGCRVTAVDLTPRQVELGLGRASAEGVDIDWHVGDVEDLPLASGVFDVVLSSFGIVYASDPSAAAAEVLRVVAPHGRALFTAWAPTSFTARMGPVVAELLDQADEADRDEPWTDAGQLNSWFAPWRVDVRPQVDRSQVYDSVDEWWDEMQAVPMVAYLRSSLSESRFAECRRRMTALALECAEISPEGRMTRTLDYVIGTVRHP